MTFAQHNHPGVVVNNGRQLNADGLPVCLYACVLHGGPRDGEVHQTMLTESDWPNGLPPKIIYPDPSGGIAVYVRRTNALDYDYSGKKL